MKKCLAWFILFVFAIIVTSLIACAIDYGNSFIESFLFVLFLYSCAMFVLFLIASVMWAWEEVLDEYK